MTINDLGDSLWLTDVCSFKLEKTTFVRSQIKCSIKNKTIAYTFLLQTRLYGKYWIYPSFILAYGPCSARSVTLARISCYICSSMPGFIVHGILVDVPPAETFVWSAASISDEIPERSATIKAIWKRTMDHVRVYTFVIVV